MAHAHTASPSPLHFPATLGALGRRLAAGALAGQVAGLVMAVVIVAVFTAVLGTSPLFPVQVIGSLVFGEAALHGLHVPALLAGLLLHQLGPSLAWGLAFGGLAHVLGTRRGGFIGLGLLVGLASQLLDVGLLVPAAMQVLHGRDLWADNVPALWSWAAHVVFGLSLGCFPWILGRLGGQAGAAEARPTGNA